MTEVRVDQLVEGVLFYKAAPVKRAALLKLLALDETTLSSSLEALAERLKGGATRLITTDTEVSLVTAPELDSLIEQLRKDDLKRDIGKAGAETLAIVLYRGPLSRSEIDRVRGVNSSYILRNLMVRGLVEKGSNTKTVQYQATPELLAQLGITDKSQLPHFTDIMARLDTYETQLATTAET